MTIQDDLSETQYASPRQLVTEFHETYGQNIRHSPEINIPERQMRIDLIAEEAEELAEANDQDDFIEIADALADSLYVVYGASLAHGVNPDLALNPTGSPANMLRVKFLNNGGVIPKAPTLQIANRKTYVEEVATAATAYKAASEAGDINGVLSAIVYLIEACYYASFAFGIDIDDVLLEVQRSNMSKLGVDGKPIYREDGKVIKGPNFFVPNIEAVLTKQGWVN